MNFTSSKAIVHALKKEEPRLLLKVQIADAVTDTNLLGALRKPQAEFETVCEKIMDFYLKRDHSVAVDFDRWMDSLTKILIYRRENEHLSRKKGMELSDDDLEEAWEDAVL